jgi:hypothetical protein
MRDYSKLGLITENKQINDELRDIRHEPVYHTRYYCILYSTRVQYCSTEKLKCKVTWITARSRNFTRVTTVLGDLKFQVMASD